MCTAAAAAARPLTARMCGLAGASGTPAPPEASGLLVVGGAPGLGAGCPGRGLALSPRRASEEAPGSGTPPTVWVGSARLGCTLPADQLEFRFAVAWPGGAVTWEEGPARRLATGPEVLSHSPQLVVARFGDAGAGPASGVRQVAHCSALALAGAPGRPGTGNAVREVAVLWEVFCAFTDPGDSLVVAGSHEALGDWDPAAGLRLSTGPSSFPRWFGSSRLTFQEGPNAAGPSRTGSEALGWKLVVLRADGRVEWEPGPNRQFEPSDWQGHTPGSSAYVVRAHYGATSEHAQPFRFAVEPAVDVDAPVDCKLLARKLHEEVARSCRSERAPCHSSPSTCSTLGGTTCSENDDADEEQLTEEGDDTWQVEFAGHWLWAGAQKLGKVPGKCSDAYFIGPRALGIADGVGSMARFRCFGVDVAAYAAELMELASESLANRGPTTVRGAPEDPAEEAAAAIAAAARGAVTYGASTAAVLQANRAGVGVANLGDSGFMLLRGSPQGMEVVAKSREQQHGFNFPYQLSHWPPALAARIPPDVRPDSAADCEHYQLPVLAGDLVLLYTDGLSDNLFEHEILEVVERALARDGEDVGGAPPGSMALLVDPERLACELVAAAKARSIDPLAAAPFSEACSRHGLRHQGGKQDDITVIAAWVMPRGAPPDLPLALHRSVRSRQGGEVSWLSEALSQARD